MAAARIDGALVYPNLPAIVADRNGIRTPRFCAAEPA